MRPEGRWSQDTLLSPPKSRRRQDALPTHQWDRQGRVAPPRLGPQSRGRAQNALAPMRWGRDQVAHPPSAAAVQWCRGELYIFLLFCFNLTLLRVDCLAIHSASMHLTPLALVPRNVALRAVQYPLAGVTPGPGGGGAAAVTAPIGQVPSAGKMVSLGEQMDAGGREVFAADTEGPAMTTASVGTLERTESPATLG